MMVLLPAGGHAECAEGAIECLIDGSGGSRGSRCVGPDSVDIASVLSERRLSAEPDDATDGGECLGGQAVIAGPVRHGSGPDHAIGDPEREATARDIQCGG
jgi:hypothetical protein